MALINYLETQKININNIPIQSDQLIHCIDNDESFFDNEELYRMETGKIFYLERDVDRTSLSSPINDKLYFVKETKLLYKYSNGWVVESDNFEILFQSNNDIKTLTPVTLKKNGQKMAPRTFASLVYTKDGITLEEIIDQLNNTMSKYKVVEVTADIDKQNKFNIPYPFTPYDIYKNALAVMYNKFVIDTDTYIFSPDQSSITLPIYFAKGDKISFIFIYSESNMELNAYTVNNIRVFLKIPPAPRLYDIVFNLFKRNIQQFDGENWNDIGSAQSGLRFKSSIYQLKSQSSVIPINIPYYDRNKDSLIVIKDSVFLTETIDYDISSDSKTIQKLDGTWDATEKESYLFTFLCLKNVPLLDGKLNGGEILDRSIPKNALSQDVQDILGKQYLEIDDIRDLVYGTVPEQLNRLEKLASAINNDPNYHTTVDAALNTINNTLKSIADLIANKIVITVNTIDGKSVDGQIVSVRNNANNSIDTYTLSGGINKITINTDKNTSYTAFVNDKSEYLTPETVTINSGHLGDIINIGIMYHK